MQHVKCAEKKNQSWGKLLHTYSHISSANLLSHSLNAVAHNSIFFFLAVSRFHWPITQKLSPWFLPEINGFVLRYTAAAL